MYSKTSKFTCYRYKINFIAIFGVIIFKNYITGNFSKKILMESLPKRMYLAITEELVNQSTVM